jgi:hypothetical protein
MDMKKMYVTPEQETISLEIESQILVGSNNSNANGVTTDPIDLGDIEPEPEE